MYFSIFIKIFKKIFFELKKTLNKYYNMMHRVNEGGNDYEKSELCLYSK